MLKKWFITGFVTVFIGFAYVLLLEVVVFLFKTCRLFLKLIVEMVVSCQNVIADLVERWHH